MKKTKIFLFSFMAVLMMGISFLVTGCNDDNGKLMLYSIFKTEYFVGEQLDLEGAQVEYIDDQGFSHIISITSDMVSSFDTSTIGTKEMVVSYCGKKVYVGYTVGSDLKLGGLYYVGPSQIPEGLMGEQSNLYFYVFVFTDGTIAGYISEMSASSLLNDHDIDDYKDLGVSVIEFQTKIVDHLKVYYFVGYEDGENFLYELTVKNDTTLHYYSWRDGPDGGEYEFDCILYAN